MTVRRGPLPFPNNKSLSFDGVNDYLEISNSTVANTGQFTLSFWVKAPPKLTPNYANLISSPYFNINTFWSIAGGNFIWRNAGNASYLLANGVFDDTWHHIMVIFNPDNRPDQNLGHIRCYIDGANVVDVSLGAPYAPGWNGGIYHGPIEFIGGNPVSGQKFVGKIDEFAAFEGNRESELAYIYNKGFPTNLNKLPVPPTAWYRMGDNGAFKEPQWLIPSNENKDKVSNYSMAFDGVNDYVSTGLNLGYTNYPNISLSCWVKMDNASLTNYTVYNPIGVYVAAFANSSPITLYRSTVGVGTKVYIQGAASSYGTTNISDGVWHHIVQTCQYDAAGTICNIYVDGNPTPEIANALFRDYSPLTSNLNIGSSTTTIRSFLGNVDEVSVFDSILSTSDIADIYNGGEPTTISGAIAHYKMGENATFSGSVWTVPDEVGTNNATSSGMLIDARVGDAPNSTNNALSLNMDFVDVVLDTP